ncbi:NAD(P)/FAD-dependent oxidoreductase [Frankia sp. CNm7]|uniref:assimilatory sulfite reductase (ferredoxin) n=1 Tax=Frankia nepalensis TaxID=1836974 RepID=A0A937UQX1_9ACTN|nr:nitrite reductase large subunit NirB [Frankia nepalensis]MBL7496159.1 NAD(P)/FAD-dependent oxidoreductase [Frankia nepalensis]MBL7508903.1 NAD(P)/FAD-dependent oxidoreductase [Frankia nepalensis]MBL7516742.1 NAD(P)/FAD-dependent oxidoreductase [Frankia nepalensis]MBL7628680.1 NAD(P)/FAD-dependent oxidoreductase [Frankia nepalensis]
MTITENTPITPSRTGTSPAAKAISAVPAQREHRQTPAGGRQRLVVVGNGMAGIRAVEEILARGGADLFEVTVFGDEPYGNYNRILLSNVLAGADTEDEIFLNTPEWYTDNGIRLRAGTRVTGLDRYARVVATEDGTVTPYDKLIIATGSRSFIPPIKGLTGPDGQLPGGVFAFRTIDDCRSMIAFAGGRRTAAVIGGGLLGLEAARGLQTYGLEVHVIDAAPTLMNQQLCAEAGGILRRGVEELGITVHPGARTAQVLLAADETGDGETDGGAAGDGGGLGRAVGLEFADGTRLDVDMIVVAAGIRPNVDVGLRGGLTVERGIVTDDQMRSVDDPDVYVVGECAQHRGQVYGLVAPLWEQATVLAEHITGVNPDAAYHGSKTATKLKVAGVAVAAMGLKDAEHPDDEVVRFVEPRQGVYKSVVIRDGKLVGATLLGDTAKSASLIQAFDHGLPLPEERLKLLFDIGLPAAEVGAAEMADEAQVCNCNGVSKGKIVACVKGGMKTVPGVMNATRAGKGCGSCKTLVKEIVEWAADGDVEDDPSANWYVPGVPMDKPTLMAAVREQELRSVSAVFAALAPDGREDAASKMALTSLLRIVWGGDFVDERDGRFINDRVHANIQKDGTFSVVPMIAGGVTSPDELRRIADVAEKYSVPMVKITGGQRIDLLGVRKEDLPKVWADLDMPSGHAYGKSFRTVKTCVGKDFCRFGVGDSTALGVAIEQRYHGLESPGKLKLAVNGCPRNCAEGLIKDVGVVAIDGGRWEIYIGGAGGAHVRKGDLLATVDSPEEVMTLTGRFLQYYRENGKWLERTYTFVPRVGIEKIRAVVVDDTEGIAADLDARIQESIDAYRDPWLERDEPATPGQFRASLPLVSLPRVPVR